VNDIILLLKFPELLINKINNQGKTPLELACENYINWCQEDNKKFIEGYAQIIQLILNHPLFDPEVQTSEGLNAYELLEQYELTL